jgi:hypothetical protein
MKKTQLYQPFLFRLLHGLIGIFSLMAMVTGFWIYNTFDGRWGQLILPKWDGILQVHSIFGILSFLVCPLFVIYAFNAGKKRLIQKKSWSQLSQFGTKIGWFSWHRLINTFILIFLVFALFTGQMMNEDWLPNGELNHQWYLAHLICWIIFIISLALHLLLSVKVGGIALIFTMLNYRYRQQDSPRYWPEHISQWLRDEPLPKRLKNWWHSPSFLKYLEILILVTLVSAKLISSLNQSS